MGRPEYWISMLSEGAVFHVLVAYIRISTVNSDHTVMCAVQKCDWIRVSDIPRAITRSVSFTGQ